MGSHDETPLAGTGNSVLPVCLDVVLELLFWKTSHLLPAMRLRSTYS